MSLSDLVIHFWLGKLRLVYFIMPEFPIADEVDHNILLEFGLILYRQCYCSLYIFNVLRINMKNRDLIGFEEISRIFGRP